MSERGRETSRRALLLLNTKARSGGSPISTTLDILRRGGVELIEPDAGDRPFSEIIAEHAAAVDLVILGGGDGTLNAAASALVEAQLPLGILPLGTANDLARTLGIPPVADEGAKIIIAGHRRTLDLGDVNGRLFFNVASIGFSAKLAKHLTSEAKKRWGKLGYAIAAFNLLRQSRPFSVDIDHDGIVERVRTVQIAVGNGRFYGGGMAVSADAEPDDGMLDIYSLEVEHWWELLALVPALRQGTQGRWKKVRTFRSTNLSLTTRREHDVNTDGDLSTVTPAHFRIHKEALQVFAPPAGRDDQPAGPARS
ncbi:lipid kinase [Aureimonas sp. SA4125]|uniref:lipid kinase n=1 Tax=Aureimonas sp. SA4125 TaxID=2826993 RepID=UPI001CC78677|nr:lipid kinase [Aureimonas sp. SA4125]BDA85617.1 lipid kinase [Aureimonas sp. SA4125]